MHKNNKISGSLMLGPLVALLLSPIAGAQGDVSATREQQAAQLRVAVDERISELDEEYAARAGELRAQFDARRQELEEATESEFVLSNAMAPISRVYQDSLAALQREINARKDGTYVAQNQANNELNRQGTISPETWSRISATPLAEYPIVPLPPLEREAATAVAQEAAPAVEGDSASTAIAAVPSSTPTPTPQATGCETSWYPDRDRDLFGDANASATSACYASRPSGFVDNDYDCDDSDPTINPITGHCAARRD